MFNLFGMRAAYKKLPPHHNFKELADNVERLADYLLDRSVMRSGFASSTKAPDRWEWQLGTDLKMLVQYARDFVPADTDGLHYHGGRRRR